MPNTSRGYPYPLLTDAPDGPAQIKALADALNADVGSLAAATTGAWTTYTGPLQALATNPTMGNSVIRAAYKRVGNTVAFYYHVTVGTTFAAGGGAYLIPLPVPMSWNALAMDMPIGSGMVGQYAGRRGLIVSAYDTASRALLVRSDTGAALDSGGVLAAWAAGEHIAASGTYEAA